MNPVPGLAKWSMFAGGTGAAQGKNGYDVRTPIGTFTIWPYTTQSGRHAGYLLTVWGAPGFYGHHRIGSYRSPQKAVKAAREFAAKLPKSNPRHGTARDIPARWTPARVKRLRGGGVQIKIGGGR